MYPKFNFRSVILNASVVSKQCHSVSLKLKWSIYGRLDFKISTNPKSPYMDFYPRHRNIRAKIKLLSKLLGYLPAAYIKFLTRTTIVTETPTRGTDPAVDCRVTLENIRVYFKSSGSNNRRQLLLSVSYLVSPSPDNT